MTKEWQPGNTAPVDGTWVEAELGNGDVTLARYLRYKLDGARQMGVDGRWQQHTGFGWRNGPAPTRWRKAKVMK